MTNTNIQKILMILCIVAGAHTKTYICRTENKVGYETTYGAIVNFLSLGMAKPKDKVCYTTLTCGPTRDIKAYRGETHTSQSLKNDIYNALDDQLNAYYTIEFWNKMYEQKKQECIKHKPLDIRVRGKVPGYNIELEYMRDEEKRRASQGYIDDQIKRINAECTEEAEKACLNLDFAIKAEGSLVFFKGTNTVSLLPKSSNYDGRYSITPGREYLLELDDDYFTKNKSQETKFDGYRLSFIDEKSLLIL